VEQGEEGGMGRQNMFRGQNPTQHSTMNVMGETPLDMVLLQDRQRRFHIVTREVSIGKKTEP
jgi:hypothetical protein